MTIAVFDLTEHTQMSIRGTTGTHPDSKFVFGIHIGTDEVHAEQLGITPDITAYEDMDWSKAVELAKMILDTDPKRILDAFAQNITDNCVAAIVFNAQDDLELRIYISVEWCELAGHMRDTCDWERAVRMAKWILEWDERLREAKE